MKARVITFDEIEQGDIVRTTREFEGGFKIVLEGRAERLSVEYKGRSWRNGRTHCVAAEHFGGPSLKDTIELVHREEKTNHIVIGTRENGEVELAKWSFYTETEARKHAEALMKNYVGANSKYGRSVYSAVKVDI